MIAMRDDITRTHISLNVLEVRGSALEGLSNSGKITCYNPDNHLSIYYHTND